jgi:energy-coupling factor transporter ATP-binding protein EcfA2
MRMLKLIAGKKGSGKTKQLITMVNEAVGTSNGKVVCIEKGSKLTYDVNHDARLLNTDDFNVSDYDSFYGFLAGIVASDYDVKEIYVDSIAKIVGDDPDKIGEFLAKVDSIASKDEINFTITVSSDEKALPENIAKFVAINLV